MFHRLVRFHCQLQLRCYKTCRYSSASLLLVRVGICFLGDNWNTVERITHKQFTLRCGRNGDHFGVFCINKNCSNDGVVLLFSCLFQSTHPYGGATGHIARFVAVLVLTWSQSSTCYRKFDNRTSFLDVKGPGFYISKGLDSTKCFSTSHSGNTC